MAGLNACLPSTLISVLPIAVDSVVVIEEVCVGCVPEGQRVDNFGILQCVPFHVFHLSSTVILTERFSYLSKCHQLPVSRHLRTPQHSRLCLIKQVPLAMRDKIKIAQ